MADATPESLIDAAHSAAVEFINGYCELVDAANDYQGGWDAELMKQIDKLNEPSCVCDLMARIAAARHLLPARKVRLGYPKPTSDGMSWGIAGSSWHDAVGRLVGVMHGSLETVFEEWTERIESKAFDPDELCAAFVEALRIYPPLCGNDVVVDLDIERREALQTIATHQSGNQRPARPQRPVAERAAGVLKHARSLYQGERDWCHLPNGIGMLSIAAMEPMVRRLWGMMRHLEQPGMPKEPIDLSDTIRLRRSVDEAVAWLSRIVEAANQPPKEPPPAAPMTPPATGTSEQGEGADALPDLPQRSYLALRVLAEMKCTSPDKSATAAEIAVRAEGKQADPASFKRPLAKLVKNGYAVSKEGTGGGYYLTVKGIDLAKRLETVR